MTHGSCDSNFKSMISKFIIQNDDTKDTYCENALRWMLYSVTHGKFTFFGKWLGALRQQTIIWANVGTDLCRHRVLLGLNDLNALTRCYSAESITQYHIHSIHKYLSGFACDLIASSRGKCLDIATCTHLCITRRAVFDIILFIQLDFTLLALVISSITSSSFSWCPWHH